MAVDLRARMVCNLGRVLEGDLSDSPMLERGIVMTSGQIVVQGFKNRPRGTKIDLAYIEIQPDGVTQKVTRFPRRLRVLNSCTDPFRNTTTFEVGCKLTLNQETFSHTDTYYAADHLPSWWGKNDFEVPFWPAYWEDAVDRGAWCTEKREIKVQNYWGDDFTWEVWRLIKVVPTIEAWPLAKFCARRLDIQINLEKSYKLRFQFMRPYIRFSDGYLDVLEKLIRSEGCYAFLDQDERLVIKKHDFETKGITRVITGDMLVDMQPITSNDQADVVPTVSYQAKRRLRTAGRVLDAYTNYERSD